MSKCSNVQTLLIVTTKGNNSRCHRYFHLIGQVSPQEAIKKLYNCHLLLPLDLDFVPFPPATTLTTSSLLLLLLMCVTSLSMSRCCCCCFTCLYRFLLPCLGQLWSFLLVLPSGLIGQLVKVLWSCLSTTIAHWYLHNTFYPIVDFPSILGMTSSQINVTPCHQNSDGW